MFLGDLKYSEKRVFLDLARMMVSADGKVTAEEREMLHDVQEEMGLDVAEEFSEGRENLDKCCQSVVSPRARAVMLLEFASFAYVDHDYDARERELLRAMAEIWQLDEISVVRIEEWAFKRVELALEAAEVIHEVDTFCTRQDKQG